LRRLIAVRIPCSRPGGDDVLVAGDLYQVDSGSVVAMVSSTRGSLWRMTVLLGVFLFVIPSGATAAAQTPAQRIVVPIEQTFFDPCTGELVRFTGELLLVQRETSDSVVRVVVSRRLVGVGDDTGRRYLVKESLAQSINFPSGSSSGPFSTTVVSTMTIVSPDADPNFRTRLFFHITRNALGELTADVEIDEGGSCIG
jgi:hypothetical protein